MSNRLKGRIVSIEKKVHEVSYLTQGIPKKNQWKYDKKYPGSNGTYITGSEYYGTTIDVKVLIYDFDKCEKFDIRDYVLRENGKKKVSSKLLDFVVDNNKGKKIVVEEVDGVLRFDCSQLNVRMPKKSKSRV